MNIKANLLFIHGFGSSIKVWDDFVRLVRLDPDLINYKISLFPYPTALAELDFRKILPSFDAIAEALESYVRHKCEESRQIVIISHSQGGLIVQRYLANMLQAGRGVELRKIKKIVMFSCPNEGSSFFLGPRRMIFRFFQNSQERQLRPLDKAVADARRVVLERVVYAKGFSDTSCPIAISTYAGLSDNIVSHSSAKGVFPLSGVLPGDHSSIIRPDSFEHDSYQAFKWQLRETNKEFPLGSTDTNPFAGPRQRSDPTSIQTEQFFRDRLDLLPAKFLECLAANQHDCSYAFPWCRAFADNTVPVAGYVVPRAKVFGGDNSTTNPVELGQIFQLWLGKEVPRNLLLLGEYGSGKTSACLHLYKILSEKYQNNQREPIPVYIPLEVFSRGRPPIASLKELVRFSIGIEHFEAGDGYIYLLDGLDEMSSDAAVSAVRANLELLRPFFGPRSKVIITCRTHLFSRESDIEAAFADAKYANDLLRDVKESHQYMMAELESLSVSEIFEIISFMFPNEDADVIWEEMAQYYDVHDLARRPILLGLILKSLPQLRTLAHRNKKVLEIDLYDAYIQSWTYRELSSKPLCAAPEKKLSLAQTIAARMYQASSLIINRDELAKEIEEEYSGDIFSHKDFQLFDYDTRDASFLSCDLRGNYRFVHRSFMEYFAAKAFLRDLEEIEKSKTWGARWLTREIASFVTQLLTRDTHARDQSLLIKAAANMESSTERWNALHILSLLPLNSVKDDTREAIISEIIPRGFYEAKSVIVRQYARVAAKFVSNDCGAALIERVLAIVNNNDDEQAENNRTYVNYYGGEEAACGAFLDHLASPIPKYDRKMHLHVLGQLGSTMHANRLSTLIRPWAEGEDMEFAKKVISALNKRALESK